MAVVTPPSIGALVAQDNNQLDNQTQMTLQQPLLQSEEGLNAARTGLLGQQTTGAGIANTMAAINLGLYRESVPFYNQQLNNYSGQLTGNEGDEPASPSGETVTPSGSPAAAKAGVAQRKQDQTAETGSGSDTAQSPPILPGAAPGVAASPQAGISQQEPATPLTNVPIHRAGIAAALRKQFFVNPAGTPQMQAAINAGAAWKNVNPMLYNLAVSERDQSVKSQIAVNQRDAGTLYSLMNAVLAAKPGAAWATLDRIDPQTAQRIQATARQEGVTPDALARHYATEVAGQAHQYTGRPIVADQAGVYRDAETGRPVTMAPQAGLNSRGYAMIAQAGVEPVQEKSGLQTIMVPRWKAAGFPSLAQYMLSTAASYGKYNGSMPGANQVHAQVRQIATAVQAAHAKATGQQPGQIQTSDPVLTKALSDKSYRVSAPPSTPGVSATPGQIEYSKELGKQKGELYNDAQEATDTASQSLMYLKAAQEVLANPETPTNISGPAANLVSQVMSAAHITSGNWATQYQEIAKNLANAALQNARSLYGNRMTQMEVRMQKEELNPHQTMTKEALKNLIKEQTNNFQYIVTQAQRVGPYLKAGNNPMRFDVWYQKYWPRQQVTKGVFNGGTKGQGTQASPVVVSSPQDAAKVPKGSYFQTPDGHIYVRN